MHPLEPELPADMSWLTWVLVTELWSSGREVSFNNPGFMVGTFRSSSDSPHFEVLNSLQKYMLLNNINIHKHNFH